MAQATTNPVCLPPGPRIPKTFVELAFIAMPHRAVTAVGRRYGSTFTLRLPIFGDTVIVGDRGRPTSARCLAASSKASSR
jgi:hypothetical protein